MRASGLAFGAGFGFFIAAGRLNEYNVIHNGLRLQDGYMFAVMGSAVLVAMAVLWLLSGRGLVTRWGGPLELRRQSIERRHVLGGIVFGTGWAVAGTCPAPALTMIGAGGLLGVVVMLGLFSGLLLHERAERRETAGGGRRSVEASSREPISIL
jgi:uncharacterized membrane protein YedE/YeeE